MSISELPPLSHDDLLLELLRRHEADLGLDKIFVETNAGGLETLWDKGLGGYSVTRFVSGDIRYRNWYGLLTPRGMKAAQACKK